MRRHAIAKALASRRTALSGGGDPPPTGLTQQEIADTLLGVTGWALINNGVTPDPSWTTVSLGGLQAAMNAATAGDTLYLAGGDFDASDAFFTTTKQLTILGNFDGTTRITGHKDLSGESWTNNGNGTWSIDVGTLGLTLRGEDTAANPLTGSPPQGNPRNSWPQMILRNEDVGHHYDTVANLASHTIPGTGEYDFPGGGNGYHLDETTDVISVNYDPSLADSVILAYSQGLFYTAASGFTFKGMTFAFDAHNNRGNDMHNGSIGPMYAVTVGGGELLVEYCDAIKCHAGVTRNWGGGSMYRHNRYRWNGMNGLNFQGSPRSVLMNCEIARNGWTSNMGDVGGGMKLKQTTLGDPAVHLPYSTPAENYMTAVPGDSNDGWNRYGTLVYRLYSHDNYGPGIWFDGDPVWSQVEKNLMVDDWGGGFLYELSQSGIIRWNHVYRGGYGKVYSPTRQGLSISTSDGTAEWPIIVEENYVEDTAAALLMIRADRGVQYELQHVTFRNNHVKAAVPLYYTDMWSGVATNDPSPKGARGTNPPSASLSMDPTALGLLYEGNHYEMSTRAFNWENTDETEAQWLARFPNDSVETVPAGIPSLSEVGIYPPA